VAKPPIRCEDVLKHLVAYLDRELDADAAADIERHLHRAARSAKATPCSTSAPGRAPTR
jgi:anti-sigma factor RsiW